MSKDHQTRQQQEACHGGSPWGHVHFEGEGLFWSILHETHNFPLVGGLHDAPPPPPPPPMVEMPR